MIGGNFQTERRRFGGLNGCNGSPPVYNHVALIEVKHVARFVS